MVRRTSASLCSSGGTCRQRHEVILDILAGGEMSFAGAEFVGDRRQLIHLRGSQRAAGDFGADHVHARLAAAYTLRGEGAARETDRP